MLRDRSQPIHLTLAPGPDTAQHSDQNTDPFSDQPTETLILAQGSLRVALPAGGSTPNPFFRDTTLIVPPIFTPQAGSGRRRLDWPAMLTFLLQHHPQPATLNGQVIPQTPLPAATPYAVDLTRDHRQLPAVILDGVT